MSGCLVLARPSYLRHDVCQNSSPRGSWDEASIERFLTGLSVRFRYGGRCDRRMLAEEKLLDRQQEVRRQDSAAAEDVEANG